MPTHEQKDTSKYNVNREEAVIMISNAFALFLETPQFKAAVRLAMADEQKGAA